MESIFDAMQPVSMAHKTTFDRYFAEYPPECSEMTFTNILSWAGIKNHRFGVYRDHLLVSYQRKSDCEPQFFPPIGENPKEIMLEPLPGLRRYQWVRIPKILSDDLSGSMPIVFDRDNSDYYYNVEDLISLKGKKFEVKRNKVRRFASLNPTVRTLEARDVTACIALQEKWVSEQDTDRSSAAEETAAVKVAFQNFDSLPMRGVAVEIDQALVAFAIGERLNFETFVEHYEKAALEFKGAYQYVLHAFAGALAAEAKFINRAQDLGIPGLREAKLGWQPAGLVEKYSARMSL
ncbi:DUF2156 domain-containing protein [Bradyrhizobium sp. sBnM-33]|uniref:DUF2156 domain-containing protein n=1 Tax=Bradyrhizobium sp. sBnM-33 TaxID=2831780 RepID=UPI001BD0FBA4|nr:phosphatidylglycerol lysyltransferase domain-containing protein [Bradyrhizobium sp. sBnM-33]WOH52494.1 phosphatidylglycerol lysyltransferase domain-containing protein [Bradyrhizobium sp. sBnM-33]